MITNLKLGNFRVFNEPVSVRFRPITVLIGRNNAGKSSIIKFLLMLQQSLGLDSPDFLNPEGEKVKLGNFDGLRNSLSKRNLLEFLLEVETSKMPHHLDEILYTLNQATAENFGADGGNAPASAPVVKTQTARDFKVQFAVGADVPYSRARAGQHTIEAKSESGLTLGWKRPIHRNSSSLMAFTHLAEQAKKTNGGAKKIMDRLFSSVATEFKGEDKFRPDAEQLRFVRDMYTEMYFEVFRSRIWEIRHIEAARQPFSRAIEAALPPEGNVGQSGKFAVPHLKQLKEAGDRQSRARIRLASDYLERTGDVKNIRFQKSKVLEAVVHATVKATNSKTGATTYLSDFGFGVSQVLPVIVQGAITPKGAQFMVEQPEAQLHPTAQLELGEFFADIWNKFGVGSIIETHSSNILLRLRRLVANGAIKKEDVSVAFFEIDKEGKATVRNLDIEPDGSMSPPDLPMEFFHADILEGLKFGAGK